MRISAAIVATLLCSVGYSSAQSALAPADVDMFDGTWVLDVARSGLPDTDAEHRVITTAPASLQVEVHRTRDARPFTLVYKLDGSPTSVPFGDGTAVSRLSRDQQGLVLESVFTVKNQPITVREVLPLRPSGNELPIAVTLRVEHGYQGPAPVTAEAPPNVAKTTKIFVKQP